MAKIPYRTVCQDGISNTFSIVPARPGQATRSSAWQTWCDLWTVTLSREAHHLNVNVLNREVLLDAMEHPEQYPTLTIRVSGYAVNFSRLSREQQLEVIKRTFHQSI